MRIYCAALFCVLLAGCQGESAPVASTSVGRFEGRRTDGVLGFLGIRYGEPPVGALRWKPPVPAAYVPGTTPATEFGMTAPQLFDIEEGSSTMPQSEDCLFLNVWTPSTTGSRPVVVFIHGGGWVNGGTTDAWYYGAHFAERGDLVMVTIDYRLGPLGFLDLSAIGGPEYAASGNLGILDQQLAMKWVRDNIAAFGGDPANITLMGQSAGGQSVAIHMALPESRALFHRAIAESGALSLLHTQATARATAQKFADFAGAASMTELLALSTEQIMSAESELEASTSFSDLLLGPVLDGTVIQEPPLDAIARGDAAGIPLLTGTTRDETKYWYFYFDFLSLTEPRFGTTFLPFISTLFDPAQTEALIAGYESRSPAVSPGDVTMQLATDALFRQPQIRLAEAHALHEPATFMYLFDWRTPILDGFYGSPHAVELPFLFRTFGMPSVDEFVGTAPPLALSDAMLDAWFAFIRTGSPASPTLPSWPPYESATRATMRFDDAVTLDHDPLADDRRAWESVEFDSVRPAL